MPGAADEAHQDKNSYTPVTFADTELKFEVVVAESHPQYKLWGLDRSSEISHYRMRYITLNK